MCGYAPCDLPSCTWGELHRRRCEARLVIKWPRAKRNEFYQGVAKTRGDTAAKQLIDDVKEEWVNDCT